MSSLKNSPSGFFLIRQYPQARACSLGVAALLLLGLSGCDFLKIKEEAVTAPVSQNTEPAKPQEAPPAPPPPPPPPPMETPEKIAEKALANFKSKPAGQRNDQDVATLASLYEPARLAITELNLETSGVTGATTRNLKAFPNLKILNLSLVETLDEASVQPILECTKLESLYIDQVKINDDFLKGLGKLDGIRDLQISRTSITERALGNLLKELPNLERLALVGLPINGSCFKLATSKKLKLLQIDHTNIVPDGMKLLNKFPLTNLSAVHCMFMGDKGVAAISGMKDLKVLNLSDNGDRLTNACMVYLGKIKSLETLRIVNNNLITDLGLARLRGLKNLKLLVVNGTGCTPAGMAQLQKLLPDLNKEGM
ncbi:MAG: hypothetical protein U0903_02040 [Planctomycetales bacterium]